MAIPSHGPLILGITWAFTIFSGIFLGFRFYAKVTRRQGLWWDDRVLLASWILLLSQAAVTQYGVELGYGKPLNDIPTKNWSIIALGSTVISMVSSIAAALSKMSFGITLLRLTSGHLRSIAWFCVVTLFLTLIPSVVGPWIQCPNIETTWNTSSAVCWTAESQIEYGIFNSAWSALMDFVLASLPWFLIWNLQLKSREKIGVGIAMSLGVLAGICAVIKGVYVVQLREWDFSYYGKDLVIWTVVEIATAIVGGSIPVLRVFLKETMCPYARSGARNNSTVPLSQLRRYQHSTVTTTVRSVKRGKEGSWTAIDEEEQNDGSSQRGILVDEEMGGASSSKAAYAGDHIVQTSRVTVRVERDVSPSPRSRSLLNTD
ncbi:hypothetical protein COCC4DRAFT_129943 [Bipolaris maydis ATCC 48331]|uniref:Rhodopsin domain-containing protein n=2 Tax=Cochliobolus heterostrophus TaxID=5016 RepID=M2UG38_COCH5|nr:uncharacterized protein COCC4DRAFT_129943 [Bipolaris maydis ATCC 48331]EMD92686.1 hypothetical protein COCHEDRAFT_1135535 [Bipolaris maydis C5]KAJ5061181.1 hypothetical protein J3E74DRAFT_474258 [Bipolaris maydis]ENI08381.1 hypothetical protein COCC4DRAFT_129943 [Bipolaris maydis ATCC 48331]KAJ6198314.1 hypothetical protein J3E72DRAFT_438990 [Bipolaris maydis]KAJ6210451.1 hypothetical protein PSV09DRAFT_1135535 [Bipolaris maydis]